MYTPWLRHPGYLTSNDDKYLPWGRMGFQWLRLLNTFRYAVKQCTECVHTIGKQKMLTSDEDLAEVQRPRVWKIGSSCFRFIWPNSNLRKLWQLTGATVLVGWSQRGRHKDAYTPTIFMPAFPGGRFSYLVSIAKDAPGGPPELGIGQCRTIGVTSGLFQWEQVLPFFQRRKSKCLAWTLHRIRPKEPDLHSKERRFSHGLGMCWHLWGRRSCCPVREHG